MFYRSLKVQLAYGYFIQSFVKLRYKNNNKVLAVKNSILVTDLMKGKRATFLCPTYHLGAETNIIQI